MGLPDPPELGASALPSGSFDGETVLVTGGGTGLGKAIAVEFARLGAAVAIASRDEEHRAAGVAAVEEAGGRTSDFSGQQGCASGREVVASNTHLHQALLEILQR